jgi:hypothetical protein
MGDVLTYRASQYTSKTIGLYDVAIAEGSTPVGRQQLRLHRQLT